MSARPTTTVSFDAIIVAGGRARRLGGADKGALHWNGVSLRDRAVAAVGQARRIVWVGDRWDGAGTGRLLFTREQPEYGGPAAAVHAGLQALPAPTAPWVVLTAVDVPRIAESIDRLLGELDARLRVEPASASVDGFVATDSDDIRQPLVGVYRTASLRAAAADRADGANGLPLRALLAGLRLQEVPLADELVADVDTPAAAAAFGIRLPVPTQEDAP
ncbi:MAG: NTP transferase domain-containing protein [Leifsonia sp.]